MRVDRPGWPPSTSLTASHGLQRDIAVSWLGGPPPLRRLPACLPCCCPLTARRTSSLPPLAQKPLKTLIPGSPTAAGTHKPLITLTRVFDGVRGYSYGPGGWNDILLRTLPGGRRLQQDQPGADPQNIPFAGVSQCVQELGPASPCRPPGSSAAQLIPERLLFLSFSPFGAGRAWL